MGPGPKPDRLGWGERTHLWMVMKLQALNSPIRCGTVALCRGEEETHSRIVCQPRLLPSPAHIPHRHLVAAPHAGVTGCLEVAAGGRCFRGGRGRRHLLSRQPWQPSCLSWVRSFAHHTGTLLQNGQGAPSCGSGWRALCQRVPGVTDGSDTAATLLPAGGRPPRPRPAGPAPQGRFS
jgi:hypothetical protein